jgi:hypothetical protein
MFERTVLWKRHDLPGHEVCRLVSHPSGWRIAGVTVLFSEGQACRAEYAIECDPQWVTRSANVEAWIGERTVRAAIARDAEGQWIYNGQPCDAVTGCVDVDLNFSPSTNLLPIRRLSLDIGASARVRAAWLRFPSFTLEPLEQTYLRLSENRYRYESAGGTFVAQVNVDDAGLVVDYGEVWSREFSAKT